MVDMNIKYRGTKSRKKYISKNMRYVYHNLTGIN